MDINNQKKQEKLEKIQYITNKCIDYVHKGFTGRLVIDFFKGDALKEEETRKKNIKLEK